MRVFVLLLVVLFLSCTSPVRDQNGDVHVDATSDAINSEIGQHGGQYPPSASPAQKAALKELNRIRGLAGLPMVNEAEALNKSSTAHARFVTMHCREYANLGLSVHQEDKGFGDGFTGQWPWDRTAAAGYSQFMGIGEVIAFLAEPVGAVDQLVNSLYHRLLLFDLGLQDVGYGRSKSNTCPGFYGHVDVMDLGMAQPPQGAPKYVLYPPDKGTDIPKSFNGYESPQPPIPPGGYPSGTMITLQFGKDARIQWLGHKLVELDTNQDIPHMAISNVPNNEAGVKNDPGAMHGMVPYIAVYAYDPLKPNTKYRVEIRFILDGENLAVASTFTTGD